MGDEEQAKALFFEALDFLDRKDFAAAEVRLREALRIVPYRVSALTNLAIALGRQGKLAEAIVAAERAVDLAPDNLDGWLAFGSALTEVRLLDEALAAMNAAISRAPENAAVLAARGKVFGTMGQFDSAVADLEAALKIDPSPAEVRAMLFSAKLQACDWRGLDIVIDTLLAQLRNEDAAFNPHILFGIPSTPADHLICASRFSARRHPAMAPLYRGERYDNERVRIAYVSGDFRQHPLPQLLAGTFEHHDRDRFETIGISFGVDDQSPIRERISKSFDRFIDVRGTSDADIAALIHRERIDIAVDLGGFTNGGRPGVFAMRPAPIQVSYLGFAGTSGSPYLDYIIADRIVIPEQEYRYYTEKIVWMPDTYYPHDSRRAIAPITPTREEEGLPHTGFVFGSFNNSRKLLPEIFGVWMHLLKEVEGSVLWLLQASDTARARLRQEAEASGVSPTRLVFALRAPTERHLARQRLADLLLDSPVRNAHTTTCDALWAGVPILTLTGQTFPGRVATSILLAAGLPELVTQSFDAYVVAALRLARQPAALARVRERVASCRRSPLFDTALYTRHLEAAYFGMVERHRQGDVPAAIQVPAEAPNL